MQRTENITYADVPGFPEAAVVSSVGITYTDALGVHQGVTLAPGAQPAAVTLAAGSYVASVQAFDAAGAALGTPATDTFDIPEAATISLSLPITLTGVSA